MNCRDGSPGIITHVEFLQQQALLGSGYAALVQLESYVHSGFHLIILSTIPEVEVALLQPYAENLDTVNPSRTSNLLRRAMLALERHITDRSGQSFNDYLYTHGLKVSQDFAALSGRLGTTISPLNIA